MNEAAQRHLLMLLDLARVGAPGVQSSADWRRQSLARFGAALAALHAVDAITEDERLDWHNRFLIAVGIEPPAGLPSSFQGARAIGSLTLRPLAVNPNTPGRFVRLLTAQVPDVAIGFGGRLQVLGVELYDSKLAVAWRLAPLPDPELQFTEQLAAHDRDSEGLAEPERGRARGMLIHRLAHGPARLWITDDVGTEYRHCGGGSGGGSDERVGRTQFTPSVSAVASELVVHWDDEVSIPIDLRPDR
jgi:hypothetical protein